MKVASDKNWQEQKSVMRQTLPDDIAEFYIDSVQKVAEGAEEEISTELVVQGVIEPTPEMVAVAVRSELKSIQESNGLLVPEAMSSFLTVLMMHWEYGQLLSDGLSSIEKTLVVDAMMQYLYDKQEEASSTE